MRKLVIDQSKVTETNANELISICPFGAIEYKDGKLVVNAACKTCGICAKRGPQGVMSIVEEKEGPTINKDEWRGIAVYVELELDNVHPVSYELIGKARELASVTKHPVYAILVASHKQREKYQHEILSYGVDKLFVYENDKFENFNPEIFARCLEDFIEKVKPSTILYGGTPLGRSFAPKVAAHFHTGLTADCTRLGMKENTDLIQVRPAFGGNVMAQIICTNRRPQMATVRYKIFKKPEPEAPHGEVVLMETSKISLLSAIELVKITRKEKVVDISEADVIVAVGRAFKSEDDIKMAEELAELLGGVVACSRPLVENGLKEAKFQIGLSGKTVAPKLIITLGISGAVQFVAGMNSSGLIISINKDPNAPIFDVSHYGIVGDVYQIVPSLIEAIKKERGM